MYTRNSIVPIYKNTLPSVHIPGQKRNQLINDQTTNNNQKRPASTRRYGLVFFGGFLLGILLAVAVTGPIIAVLNSKLDGTTTVDITISTTTTTSTATTMAPLQWNSTGITVAGTLSITSATPTTLYLPIGIWLDSSDTLFVADASNNRIQRFVVGNTTGTTVCGSRNGIAGSNSTLLTYPNDITIDASGNIFVVDTNNHRVQLWRVNATAGITIAGTGTAGNSTGTLNSPRAIAIDLNTNTYYISDTGNNRIMQFTINSTVGVVIAGGRGAGNNITQLNDPRGLYFDSSTNSLIIANRGANNIVRWVIGASSWTIVVGSISGTVGSTSTTLNSPWDVTLDAFGNIYVADRYNHRIQFFLANQTNGTTIAGATGIIGTSATRFNEPISVALDSQLNLFVADAQNERIQKIFRY